MLSSSYLKDAARRDKITAWIYAAGLQNGTTMQETTIADLNTEADARIAADQNINEWEIVKNELSENPSLATANKFAYSVTNMIPEVLIKVSNTTDFKFTTRAISSNAALFEEITKTNNNPVLKNVTMPCLILWGKYDFAVSKTYEKEFLANIASKNVTAIDFNASGHYMMFHEPELFAKSVINFTTAL